MKRVFKCTYSLFAIVSAAMGVLTANGAPGDLFASVNGGFSGIAVGSIYQYTPDGVQSTFASGLIRPRGLAFDSKGNLFVASAICVGNKCEAARPTVLKFTPDGTQTVFATMPVPYAAEGLAIDRFDNVFVLAFKPFNISTIYKFAPDGRGGPFGFLNHYPGTEGFGLAFDSAGNLFVADASAQTIYDFAPNGTRSIFVGPEAFGSLGGPIGLAFDQSGNLFVSTVDLNDVGELLEFTPSRVETMFAVGLNAPRGLAFDGAGNLFVAEIPAFTTGDILKFTPDGASSVLHPGSAIRQAFTAGRSS